MLRSAFGGFRLRFGLFLNAQQHIHVALVEFQLGVGLHVLGKPGMAGFEKGIQLRVGPRDSTLNPRVNPTFQAPDRSYRPSV